MTQERIGNWMQTRSGLCFYHRDPRPEEVLIEDIAFGLSNMCRYGGHVEFYSVAEHSVLVAQTLRDWGFNKSIQLQGLMHDATEAYCVDVPRPLKAELHNYKEIEDGIWRKAIAPRFGLPDEMHEAVHRADNAVLLAERPQLFVNGLDRPWNVPGEPADIKVLNLAPATARAFFLNAFDSLYYK